MPPGNYFSAEVEAGKVRRVKVMKVDRIWNTAHANLIDYGYELDIPWKKLVPLDTEFWAVRAQALKIQLDGFVSYHNLDVLEFAKKKLVGRRVFGREVNASLSQTVPLVNIFEADPKGDLMFVENLRDHMRKVNLGEVAPVVGGRELGIKITINNNIADEKPLAQTGSLKLPTLPGVEDFYDCVVVEVAEGGELYVQPYDNLNSLMTLNRQMLAFYSVNAGSPIQKPASGNEIVTILHYCFKWSQFSFPRPDCCGSCGRGLVQGSDRQEVGLLVGFQGESELPGETRGHRETGDYRSGIDESPPERVPLAPQTGKRLLSLLKLLN